MGSTARALAVGASSTGCDTTRHLAPPGGIDAFEQPLSEREPVRFLRDSTNPPKNPGFGSPTSIGDIRRPWSAPPSSIPETKRMRC